MISEECSVNDKLISKIEIVNQGCTKNFNQECGPHECEYLARYSSLEDGRLKQQFEFTVYHDRLEGHSKLIEKCRRKIYELETS